MNDQITSEKRLRIIFIQPKYAHYRHGLFELLDKNYNITFVFLNSDGSEYDYPTSKSIDPSWHTVIINSNRNRDWALSLAKLILRTKPDAVVSSINGSTQSIVSSIIRRFYKIPFVLYSLKWTDRLRKENQPSWKVFIRKSIDKWVTFSADSIVVGGNNSRKYHQDLGIDPERIFLAYQSTLDHSLGLNHSDGHACNSPVIRILYFSRIVVSKGLDTLIRSFKKLTENYDNVKLVVAGDGPFKQFCEKMVKDMQISNVFFLGSIPNEDAWKIFMDSDIFVLPCNGKGRGEGWGLVLNEAASMSLPIITTDAVGAVGDLIINQRNGFVVQAGNIDQLTQKMKLLIESESLRDIMGRESRNLFEEKNSYQNMFVGFQDAINHAINSAKSRTKIKK